MEDVKVISGSTEQEIWNVVEADLTAEEDLLSYDVVIEQGDQQIELFIDIDLGGGFESGSQLTQLTAPLSVTDDFKFAIHHEGFLDTIGKFFGMEDLETGYPELDNHVVIKTNVPEKVRVLFADETVRNVFMALDDFDFGIHTHTPEGSSTEQTYLEFNVNEAITEPSALRHIYHAFYEVLVAL